MHNTMMEWTIQVVKPCFYKEVNLAFRPFLMLSAMPLLLAASAWPQYSPAHPLALPHVHTGAALAQNTLPVRKLIPAARRETLQAPQTVAPGRIRQFISESRIVRPDELAQSGYIVSSADGSLLLSTGSRFYARDLPAAEMYDLIVPGEILKNPQNGEVLGLEAIYLGRAQLLEDAQANGLAQLEVLSARDAVKPGTRLLAARTFPELPDYAPQPGPAGVSGQVLKTADEMGWAGQNDVVILSVGQREGVDVGHLFATIAEGNQVTDPVTGQRVQLPAQPSGELLVLQSYQAASHALVIRSDRPISAGTRFTTP